MRLYNTGINENIRDEKIKEYKILIKLKSEIRNKTKYTDVDRVLLKLYYKEIKSEIKVIFIICCQIAPKSYQIALKH